MDAPALADLIEMRIRAVGTPKRAIGEKAYLKSDLDFLGATVWDTRRVVKAVLAEHPLTGHDEVVALAEALWAPPIHERRAAAVDILDGNVRVLTARDLPVIERLLRESRTWALVDELAVDVLGPMVEADADALRPALDAWSTDADFWIRRASLLAELLPIRHGAPMIRFLERADRLLDEREFFIRKAIGWVLREAGKKRPDEVADWLAPRTHRASGVTMREAVKRLSDGDAERLMAAYRERRPAA